jgi:hypothetical protein
MKPLPKDSFKINSDKIKARAYRGKSTSPLRRQSTDALWNKTTKEQPPTPAEETKEQKAIQQVTQETQTEQQPLPKPAGAQIVELMTSPNNWGEDSRFEFLWRYSMWSSVDKYYDYDIRMMKQSLSNFGARKKFTPRATDYDYIGLCLRGTEFCRSNNPRATKIGQTIWKVMYRDKGYFYVDSSKVKEEFRISSSSGARELVVDFDVQARTLTVSDFLNGNYKKISVLKILEQVDLSKVNLYFNLDKSCDDRLNVTGIEFETYNQPLVNNKYDSIVKAKDEGIYCILLDKSLIPFKKYKFELDKTENAVINGVGIFRKDKIAANHYRANWSNGYQANCGMIAVDCNGSLMHDNENTRGVYSNSGFVIRHRDEVVVEYDPVDKKVSFYNSKTEKRISHSYPIDIDKTDDYFVGAFLGNGNGSVSVK